MKKIQVLILFVLLTACSPAGVSPTEPPFSDAPTPAFTQNPLVNLSPTPPVDLESTLVGVEAGRIAFTSEVDGVASVYVVNMDGSDLFELTADISPTFSPVWSHDGRRISFSSNDEKSGSLYLANADGTNIEKVLDTRDFDLYDSSDPDIRFSVPCCSSMWSPDGGRIAFQTGFHDGCCASLGYIYILSLEDKTVVPIEGAIWSTFLWSPDGMKFGLSGTDYCGDWWSCVFDSANGEVIPFTVKLAGKIGTPSWSPDGAKIAYTSDRESNNSDVYVTNEDGSNPVNVSKEITGENGNFAWSPDGRRIAFVSYNFELGDLYIASLEDSKLINLTEHLGGSVHRISWMPDSSRIIFEVDGDGDIEIYIANMDGTGLVNLTNNPADDTDPVLSPNASKLAFVSDRDGDDDIYILNLATMELFNLTNNDIDDHSPVWQP